jgi:hypothetical protein
MKNYYTPEWLSVIFVFAIAFPIFLIAHAAKQNAPHAKQNAVFYSIIAFFLAYFSYIGIGSHLGLFDEVLLPPKILLLSTIPYAIFLFVIVYNLPITKAIISKITLQELVALHIFRLIGGTFIILAFYDALPKNFAFIAGVGDVVTAVTSIFVVKIIKNQHRNFKIITFLWNTFGLLDIITTAVLANLLTKISIDTGAMGVDTLAKFPFSLIPAFAPPTIIFLHLLIYRKLKKS